MKPKQDQRRKQVAKTVKTIVPDMTVESYLGFGCVGSKNGSHNFRSYFVQA
jgi:hypothetical protein